MQTSFTAALPTKSDRYQVEKRISESQSLKEYLALDLVTHKVNIWMISYWCRKYW